MISLFEPVQDGSRGLPLELVTRGLRGVSLLEFMSFDAAPAVAVDEEAAAKEELRFKVDERAAQVATMVEAAREEAATAMKTACDAETEMRVQAERGRAERACAAFAADRQRYFAVAEGQVVKLALAIARRVLAREVAADAMHLQATVRAALARVQDGSRPVLRVCGAETAGWAALLGGEVEVVAEERVAAGECWLETKVGSVELGVRPQIDEIERGMMELTHREVA